MNAAFLAVILFTAQGPVPAQILDFLTFDECRVQAEKLNNDPNTAEARQQGYAAVCFKGVLPQ